MIRSAKGDDPDRSTLFNNVSGNKMIDTFNKERYTIMYSKNFKLTARNAGTQGGAYTSAIGGNSGINLLSGDELISRATKIQKIWSPGRKFGRRGRAQYENASTQVKFHDYHCLLYAYSNHTTSQDLWYVARLNDVVVQLYYKDA